MREAEMNYWDDVAIRVKGRNIGGMTDNIWKRCAIVSRILAHRPAHARVLEIGVGQGLAAAVTNMVCLGNMKYIGTDVSPAFCEFVEKRWKLQTVNTDVRKLPDGPFDMVWAFDALEHVRPEDRDEGYREINRVLDDHGVILLNVPRDESGHNDAFDFGQDDADIINLARITHTQVHKWEPYYVEEVERNYLWVELCR